MLDKHHIMLTAAAAALAFAATTASAQSAPPPSSATPAAVNASAGDNEVIVTAAKRKERLQDVPAAVTAITARTLQVAGIQSFHDYATLTPGLSQAASGAPGLGTIIIRGLNTGAQQTSNTAAFYIDDTPFTASGFLSIGALVTPEPELADVERIEVLKGPQGTLYGASSLGGLIHLVTVKPNLETYSGSLTAEVSGNDYGGLGGLVRGTVNVPVIQDKLAIDLTGFYRDTPGYTQNVTLGTKAENSSDAAGGRVAIRFKPTDKLAVDASVMYQNTKDNGFSFEQIVPGSNFQPAYGDYKYAGFIRPEAQIDYTIANATADYDTGVGSLIGSVSYGHYAAALSQDYSDTYGPYIEIYAPLYGYTGSVAGTHVDGYFGPDMDKYTAEARFNSIRFGAFEFIGGFFYTNETTHYPFHLYAFDSHGVPYPAPYNLPLLSNTDENYQEYAGFADVDFHITEQLDVEGGVRYSQNHQYFFSDYPETINFYAVTPTVNPTVPDINQSDVTYLATLRWRPSSDFTAYLRYATGYRPGGPQTAPAGTPGAEAVIQADTTADYEGGVKGLLFGGKVSYDADIYHIDWTNVQLNGLTSLGLLEGGNGGAAKVDGAEIEVDAAPIEGLTVGATFGYTDARLTKISAAESAALGAVVGDALPGTSRYTASALGDYVFPLSGGVQGTVGGTVRYQSSFLDQFPARDPSPTHIIPAYATVDGRVGLIFDRYTIQFRVANLLNQINYSSYSTTQFDATTNPPRTYTLSLSAKF
jgi:outer membrane receptor protein involved in Fe transport